jgi:Xaa-Pro aminopeptidase
MKNSIIKDRLAALRGEMRATGVSAYIVSDADVAGSEIPAARFRVRTWLTGFDGSAGTCVVTADAAWLWTDGRYRLQAEDQLAGTGIELMNAGADGVPEIEEFLAALFGNDNAESGGRNGRDSFLLRKKNAGEIVDNVEGGDFEACRVMQDFEFRDLKINADANNISDDRKGHDSRSDSDDNAESGGRNERDSFLLRKKSASEIVDNVKCGDFEACRVMQNFEFRDLKINTDANNIREHRKGDDIRSDSDDNAENDGRKNERDSFLLRKKSAQEIVDNVEGDDFEACRVMQDFEFRDLKINADANNIREDRKENDSRIDSDDNAESGGKNKRDSFLLHKKSASEIVDNVEGDDFEACRVMQDFEFRDLKINADANKYSVGICGDTTMAAEYDRLADALEPRGITVRDVNDLFENIWDDRPEMPREPIFLLDNAAAKRNLKAVREKLTRRGADCTLICALESVAWLFGFRGSDLEHTPVAYARAFVSQSEAILFINPDKIPASVMSGFKLDGVSVREFSDAEKFLGKLPEDTRLIYDPRTTSIATRNSALNERHFAEPDPVYFLKAIKTDGEIENLRRCHERDGHALVRFFMWLEEQVGGITEYDAARKLSELRASDPLCLGDSFETICAFGANGAIVHYSPRRESARVISAAKFKHYCSLLVDSGGQYLDGTTDITRTVLIHNISQADSAAHKVQDKGVTLGAHKTQGAEHPINAAGIPDRQNPDFCRDYTLVLKAHIALASAEFHYGASGAQLDSLCRRVIQAEGFDYAHGTGHGVGYALNVHEAPPNISATPRNNSANITPIEPNMVFSNEPGLYRAGKYGIRIENLLSPYIARENEFGKFLKLETLSLCPIDLTPVVPELLTTSEVDWLNVYHREVYERLSPELTEEEKIWLETRTAQI